jgi:hypothetical protein
MSNNPQIVPRPLAEEIAYYLEPFDLSDHLPINKGLASATQETMISFLGSPLMPLTTSDQPSKASPVVKQLTQTCKVSLHVVVTAIKPALESLERVLKAAFAQELSQEHGNHDLESVLGTEGMLVVRLRRPTSGNPSKKISNHAWGTAIDMKITGHSAPANTGHTIPRFIAILLPFFNKEGWYSGISFQDTMHFEVAEGTIREWSDDGKFKKS